MQDQIIVCPQCSTQIPLTKALTDPILNQYKEQFVRENAQKEQELQQKFQEKELKLQQNLEQLTEKSYQLENLQKTLEEKAKVIDTQVQEKLQVEKEKLAKEAEEKLKTAQEALQRQAQEKAKEQVNVQLQDLTNQTQELTAKLKKSQEEELQWRKEKRELEEREKNIELELQRKLQEERAKIEENAIKRMSEEHRLKEAENDKKFQDAQRQIEDMQRRLAQGSQQTQGEILELELEEMLRAEFPLDEILPVEKGITGADLIQKVYDRSGRLCGTIIWEFKRTKAWSDGWIQKLKDDQRAQKAEIAVLVSMALPKDIKNFHFRDGIWITASECCVNLAHALRLNLLQVAGAKNSSIGKNEKMEIVYNYLTGTEFKQRVEAIVEAFIAMREDLEKEKRLYQKIWAKREKQIQRVIDNTFGMHGDLEGLMGGSLPQIKLMEFEEGEEEQTLI